MYETESEVTVVVNWEDGPLKFWYVPTRFTDPIVIPQSLSPEVRELLEHLLAHDQGDRPNAASTVVPWVRHLQDSLQDAAADC
jgi:hypothetical protein